MYPPLGRGALMRLLCTLSAVGGCSAPADSRDEQDAEHADAPGPAEGGAALRDASTRDASLRDAAPGAAGSFLDAATTNGPTRLPDGALGDAALPTDAAPSLRVLIDTFFVPTCVLGRCHTTLAPAGDLSLTDRNVSVYEALVNAPSSEVPERMRVVPHDPDASYLIEKLERDEPAVGTRMPPPFAVLPQEQIARVRAWILAGAPRE